MRCAGGRNTSGPFLQRLKRALGKEGVELRYIAVTSDMDGDTGEAVRYTTTLSFRRAGCGWKTGRSMWENGG